MAIYFDVSRTYLKANRVPTGVARSLFGLCSAALAYQIRPVVFNPNDRRWYQLAHFVPLSVLPSETLISRTGRAMGAGADKIAYLLGFSDFLKLAIKKVQLTFSRRIEFLKGSGSVVEFSSSDALYLIDLNLTSIPYYGRELTHIKGHLKGFEIVSLVHDVIPIDFPKQAGFVFRLEFREWIGFLNRVSDRIMTNSQSVAEAVSKHVSGNKSIRSVRFGSQIDCLPELKTRTQAEQRSGVVSVGTNDRRKNQVFLLDAIEPLWISGQLKVPLLIIGQKGSETRRLKKKIRSSEALRKNVTLLGAVEDEKLFDLYRGAQLSILPSLNEGFGLPVSESLQLGCPCFASAVGGVPEVAQHFVEYFDPKDPEQLRRLVLKFFSDGEFSAELKLLIQGFRPHRWSETVSDLISATELGAPELAIASVRSDSEAIDAVYTWCDESDPDFANSLSRYRNAHEEGAWSQRFRDSDELMFSLRSLETYAPWVRNVILVTNGQIPAWLKRTHPRLRVVTHREIFEDLSALPTFNSLAIETNLFRIPGLSEYFLYLNDDFFIGDHLTKESFFTSQGRPVFSVDRFKLPAPRSRWFTTLRGDDLMKRCHRYNHQLLQTKVTTLSEFRNPSHVPQLYSRKLLSQLNAAYQKEVSETQVSRFRRAENVKVSVLYPVFASEVFAFAWYF